MFRNKLFIGIIVLMLATIACNTAGNTGYTEADVSATLTTIAAEATIDAATPTPDIVEEATPEIEEEATPEEQMVAENAEAPILPPVEEVDPFCYYDADFVADVTIPDGTVIEANQPFTKTWRLRNTACSEWNLNVNLVFIGGTPMNGPAMVAIGGPITLGETVDVSVDLIAPAAPGTYDIVYQLENSQGDLFGPEVYANIIVPEPVDEATPVPDPTDDPTPEPTEEPEEEPTPEPTPEDDDDDGPDLDVPLVIGTVCFHDISFPNGQSVHVPKPSTVAHITVKNEGNCDWPTNVTVQHQGGTNFLVNGPHTVLEGQLLDEGQTGVITVPIVVAFKPQGIVEPMVVRFNISGKVIEKNFTIIYVH